MSKKYILSGFLFCCLTFLGCPHQDTGGKIIGGQTDHEDDNGDSASMGDTTYVTYKNAVFFPEEGITLSFDALLNESRCPMGVDCVWAGDARVAIGFRDNGHTSDIELHTHRSLDFESTIRGYTVELIDVKPYPEYGIDYIPEDYSVIIYITKNKEKIDGN